jgi:hypothetical protein
MRIGSPQHGQRSAARRFTQAVIAAGTIFINTTCNSAIRRLLLGADHFF